MKMKSSLNFKTIILKIVLVVLLLSLSFTLTSCGDNDSQTSGQYYSSNSELYPNLLQSQASRIFQDSVDALNSYYTSGDETTLLNRVSDSEAAIVRSERQAINTGNAKLDDTTLKATAKQYIISKTTSWPRTFIVISAANDESISNIVTFSQANIYSNYKICAKLRVFENTELPKFEIPVNGSSQMNIYDQSLKLDILSTINQYSDILTNGASSKYANNFLIDKFQGLVKSNHAEASSQLLALGGSSDEIFTPYLQNIHAMKTYNSGAFVIAQINSNWQRSGNDKVFATPSSPAEKALFSGLGLQLRSGILINYTNFVAFYIPPSNSDDDIKVLGAERYPVSIVTN